MRCATCCIRHSLECSTIEPFCRVDTNLVAAVWRCLKLAGLFSLILLTFVISLFSCAAGAMPACIQGRSTAGRRSAVTQTSFVSRRRSSRACQGQRRQSIGVYDGIPVQMVSCDISLHNGLQWDWLAGVQHLSWSCVRGQSKSSTS